VRGGDLLSLPSPVEARLVALELSYRELVVGDQIGPADVLQPVVQTVVAVPEVSTEDRFAARAALKLESAADGTVTTPRPRVSDTIFVRRYFATVTVTRNGGAVDVRKPKMWFRPVGDAVTLVNPERLKLQPGDSISIVAA
jgi:hypothetical protein